MATMRSGEAEVPWGRRFAACYSNLSFIDRSISKENKSKLGNHLMTALLSRQKYFSSISAESLSLRESQSPDDSFLMFFRLTDSAKFLHH